MTRRDRIDFLFCGAIISVFALAVALFFASSPRAKISNDATYAQVVKNFSGKPYSNGHFVSGYSCAGYTAGKHGHGWVVIRCSK